jgi:peptidoglycan/xylan/chitin deacetylase (PgdA/CDA1 family)
VSSKGLRKRPVSSLEPPPQGPQGPWWKRAAAAGLYHSGLLRLVLRGTRSWEIGQPGTWRLQRASKSKNAILCYHRVGISGVPLYSALPPEVFEAQMRYLRKRYRIVSLAELCAELAEPRSCEPSVAITFDDGYGDLWHHAFPVLQKLRIPATIFLAVDAIETGQVSWYDRIFAILQVFPGKTLELGLDIPFRFRLGLPLDRLRVAENIIQRLRVLPDGLRQTCCAELERRVALPEQELCGRMLSWDQIRAMHGAGISFGSHTMSHRVLGRLRVEEVRQELVDSKKRIEEKLGCVVDTFAYPFGQPGDIGSVTGGVLADCGYRCGLTTVEGTNAPAANPYRLSRTQIVEERSLPVFASKLSKLFLRAPRLEWTSSPPRVTPRPEESLGTEAGHA